MLALAARYGGKAQVAVRDGRMCGVSVSLPPGAWPPPARSLALRAPAALIAGPGTTVRGLRAERVLEEGHPRSPHRFLWMLAVDPRTQRAGCGSALIQEVLAAADRGGEAVHLDTANPDNLPYYHRFGFSISGEARMPGATPVWFMLREPRGRQEPGV